MTTDIELISSPNQTEQRSRVKLQSGFSRFHSYIGDDIDIKRVDCQLITLGFATGIADVMSYRYFSVYTSNQTGNSIIFAIGLTGIQTRTFPIVCAGLFAFILAGGISGQIGHRIGDHRRWWLIFNNFFQSALIFVVVALISKGIFPVNGNDEFVLILLLSISFGCQTAMAKRMSCPEIPTVALTSPLIDLVSDPNLFKRHNTPRNRRLFYIIFFMGGIIVGSFVYSKVSSEMTLALCGIVKSLVTISFFFNPKNEPQNTSSE